MNSTHSNKAHFIHNGFEREIMLLPAPAVRKPGRARTQGEVPTYHNLRLTDGVSGRMLRVHTHAGMAAVQHARWSLRFYLVHRLIIINAKYE
jgi:hypothetical protein